MKFYQNKKQNELIVGLFTIVAIIILILAYSWFTNIFSMHKYELIRVKFANISTVEKGSPVTIFGVKRGFVEKFNIVEDGVIADLKVDLEYPLKSGATFRIVEADLMGNTQIEIIQGKGEIAIDLLEIQQGSSYGSISELIKDFSNLMQEVKLLFDFGNGEQNFVAEIEKLITNLNQLVKNLNKTYFESSKKFEKILENSEEISSVLSEIVIENDIGETLQMTNQAMTKLNTIIEDIKKTNQNFQKISQKLLENDSSLNKLITEKELYDNLLRSTSNLDSLLIDIKKNPKKYFQVKIL